MGKKRKLQNGGKVDDVNENKKQKGPLQVTACVDMPVISDSQKLVINKKWKNRNRVLIFSSRGISFRDRHLMNDFRTLMPHSKADTKMDKKDQLFVINEICEMKNCQMCIYFESKKKKDLYVWLSKVPEGPSVKFLVENIHTMLELKMTGNCLRGSRPILSFDQTFDEQPHWALLKELLTQIFSTPRYHPKSQPFVDHVFSFNILDGRIWFRNFQILEENGELTEIGPRLVLNPIRFFSGSFGGTTLYQNPKYISPNLIRRMQRKAAGRKYTEKTKTIKAAKERHSNNTLVCKEDVTDNVFQTT